MRVTLVDSRLQKHCFDVDHGASIAHIKTLLLSMSLVPSGFLSKLCYAEKILRDDDSLDGIGYSPEKSISFVCVRALSFGSRSPDESLNQAATAASGVDHHRPLERSSSPTKTTAQPPAPASETLQEGSRVRIQGLQATPEMNGRTGVVCGAISQESGRWTVRIDAIGARAACRGAFRPANLQEIWVDEDGCVWQKNVDFSRECAKGHALAPLGVCVGDGGGMRLMCRLCHSFCRRDSDEAASWLMCSFVTGCCGGYAVCFSCALAPSAAAAVTPAGSDDFCTLVSFGIECCMMWRLTFCAAGRWTAVSFVAAVDVGRVAGPHDDVPVLSNVRAAVHVAQPRQRAGAVGDAGRDGAACGRCDVVHQPRVEQRVCRHA